MRSRENVAPVLRHDSFLVSFYVILVTEEDVKIAVRRPGADLLATISETMFQDETDVS